MPKVSLLMPTYNQGQYIAEAIDSATAQTFADYEFIIVNDASTDDTEQIIEKYSGDARIKVYKNEPNLGDVGNLNKISELARGEYVKFLFSDDLFSAPNALELFVKALDENKNVSLATSFYEYFDAQNSSPQKHAFTGKLDGYEAIKNTAVKGNWIGGPSNVIFRRADFAGMEFEKKWRWLSDLDVWHRLLTKGDLYVIPEFLVKFRIHEKSWSSDNRSNFNDHHDEYYYLKNIRDNNLYAPLKDDKEFKAALAEKALKWATLIPRFYKNSRYDLIKKGVRTISEEKLAGKFAAKIVKKIGRKFSKN